jgi:CRP/FNR family transcriptional regulator
VTYVTWRQNFGEPFGHSAHFVEGMISKTHDLAGMRRAALRYSLSRAPIFSGLPDGDLERLSSYAQIRALRRGAYLFRERDPVVGFFVVRLGLIHVHRINAEGGEQVIHLLRPGESFAERAIVSEDGYPANARAVENSEVILIPTEEFKRHQREQPDLAWRMVASTSHHLRSLVTAIEGLRFNDAETRVIHWILQRCPVTASRKPVEIAVGMNQTELATELATRRETLSRILRGLRASKYIEVKGRSIQVLDMPGLQKLFSRKTSKR